VEITLLRQCFCNFVGLIKPSPPFAPPMKGNWNNNPGRGLLNGDAGIAPEFFHEQGQFTMEMDLPAVFVGVHDLVGLAVSARDRARKVEKIIHPSAMGAQHILRDVSLDFLSAFHAIRFFNAWKAFATWRTEVTPLPQRSTA